MIWNSNSGSALNASCSQLLLSIKYHLEVFITAEGGSLSHLFGQILLLKLASFDIAQTYNEQNLWSGFYSNQKSELITEFWGLHTRQNPQKILLEWQINFGSTSEKLRSSRGLAKQPYLPPISILVLNYFTLFGRITSWFGPRSPEQIGQNQLTKQSAY